jgi:hypothetical protein
MKFEEEAGSKDSQVEKPKTEILADTDQDSSKDNNEEQVRKRMRAMSEIRGKYQKEHPDVAVEGGTLARKTELEDIASNLSTRIGKVEGGQQDFASREELLESLNKAIAHGNENEEILNTKLGFMDPKDIDRLAKIAQRKKEIGLEKQENDSVIYGEDKKDMGAKGEAARKNIALEKEEGDLYAETEQMFETKYKGLGRI